MCKAPSGQARLWPWGVWTHLKRDGTGRSQRKGSKPWQPCTFPHTTQAPVQEGAFFGLVPRVQVLVPRETAPWPLWISLPHDHLAKLRLRLVSMGTKGKSRPRLTTMMKIYLGSKSRKKPQAQRVVNGGGRENRRRGEGKGGGPPRLFQCLQLLFIAVPDDLKIIRWGRGSLGVRVHGAIYEAFPFLGGQSCDHMSLCFSKLHVCFCSFCQTKSIQLVATFKES